MSRGGKGQKHRRGKGTGGTKTHADSSRGRPTHRHRRSSPLSSDKMNDIVEILQMRGHHFLWIGNELNMWDIPSELLVQKSLSDQAYGNVLCVGYGLGLVQGYLLENPKVKRVVTIERYQCVIDANKNTFGKLNGHIVIGHFFKPPICKNFDFVIGDVCADIMPRYLPIYKRFKRKAEEYLKPTGKFITWCGDFFEYLIKGPTSSAWYEQET